MKSLCTHFGLHFETRTAFFVAFSNHEDEMLWKKFEKTCKSTNMRPSICRYQHPTNPRTTEISHFRNFGNRHRHRQRIIGTDKPLEKTYRSCRFVGPTGFEVVGHPFLYIILAHRRHFFCPQKSTRVLSIVHFRPSPPKNKNDQKSKMGFSSWWWFQNRHDRFSQNRDRHLFEQKWILISPSNSGRTHGHKITYRGCTIF